MNAAGVARTAVTCAFLALAGGAPLASQPARGEAGAFATGQYRNLFREAGHSDQEIRKKIDAAFQQLFHGDPDTQAVFYWSGQNANGRLAYLSDINNRDVRSEGMSYGMMIAVQLDKKAEFDALWNWSRTFMFHDDPAHPAYGFFSWSMKTDGTPNSESPAPDGEEYYVMALYFASARWGDGKGIYDYRAAADRLLSDIKNRGVITGPWASRPDRVETDGAQFNLEHKMVRFTPDNKRPDHTDPSYHLPAFYELWARWGPAADRAFWAEAARVSRDFLEKATDPATGLAPEYANYDATPVTNSRNQRSATFGPDAWRTAANWSVDWAWWAADQRARARSDRLQAFFEAKGIGTYGNRWPLDGTAELESNHSPALVAANAVASLAATHPRAAKFVEALWNTDVPSGRYRYYDGLWYLMGLLHCSGEYRIWTPKWAAAGPAATLRLNELEYLEMPGLNVMLAHDYYPEGHQGGVGIIQNGLRVAANGDVRLDRTPGQWQPVPKVGKRVVDRATQEISLRADYPDESKNRKGFNPIEYPDIRLSYNVRVRPEGAAFRIVVDLDAPLPDEWAGRVGFNLELFPGLLFGKTFATETQAGVFPRQPAGPGAIDARGEYQIEPMAMGRRLVVAPESDRQRMLIEDATGGGLELVDGRGQHTNGWFVVRSRISRGATKGAVNWLVTPHAVPGWISPPVVQVSQVGYHPKQQKWAVIELDRADTRRPPIVLSRISESGALETVLEKVGDAWGRFLRFDYLRLDFSPIERPGMYIVQYGGVRSEPFRIGADVFARGVWQPTLEYFLPVQMCHMRVNDRYRVWHDVCHLDDARMAPVAYNHFDGYMQGPSTLTAFQPGQHVPGLDRGGWHDAGDDDLRIESQADTVLGLSLAFEAFGPRDDNTTIDQAGRVVEIHRPDGKPDMLQQIEHGVLTVAGSYRALGRFYRGMIVPTLRQYVHVGDFGAQTDNAVFTPGAAGQRPPAVGTGVAGSPDDRWVFTEQNPRRELSAAAALAAASRVLRGYDDALAAECLRIAEAVWEGTREEAPPAAPGAAPARPRPSARIGLAVELLAATKERRYADYLVGQTEAVTRAIGATGWIVGRALPLVNDSAFTKAVTEAARGYRADVEKLENKTPYGVPYEPDIWGAGWGIQRFGMQQYFLHTAFPAIFPKEPMLHALDFVLGVHPGPNTASFVSGVGARSVTVAYGLNRADWSHIPGGSVSGTALIRPDFPELLEWPFLWQQTEYVLGGGTTDYLFLALAADRLLNAR